MVHLIISQITVDIFLLDWERPKAVSSCVNSSDLAKEEAVSVWRTYLVANEWNELQTRRKTNVGLQIIILILLFQVSLSFMNHRLRKEPSFRRFS